MISSRACHGRGAIFARDKVTDVPRACHVTRDSRRFLLPAAGVCSFSLLGGERTENEPEAKNENNVSISV